MEALTIIVMLMAILAGVIGMGALGRLHRSRHSPEVKWTFRSLLAFNLLLIVGLGFRYLEYHLSGYLSPEIYDLVRLLILDFLIPLKLAFLFSLERTAASLAGGVTERKIWRISRLVFLAAGLAIILISAVAFPLNRTDIAFGAHNAYEIPLIGALIFIIAYHGLAGSSRAASRMHSRALRTFSVLHAGIFGGVGALLVLNSGNPQGRAILIGAGLMVVYNILLVLWALRFLPLLVAQAGGDGPEASQLLKEFGITRREEEVIRLICEGKTNKEIAEALYISIQTVKDHSHNIYRKTGVSNRVQLANMFRDTGA